MRSKNLVQDEFQKVFEESQKELFEGSQSEKIGFFDHLLYLTLKWVKGVFK